jgi:hypothetical protein
MGDKAVAVTGSFLHFEILLLVHTPLKGDTIWMNSPSNNGKISLVSQAAMFPTTFLVLKSSLFVGDITPCYSRWDVGLV